MTNEMTKKIIIKEIVWLQIVRGNEIAIAPNISSAKTKLI